MNWFINLNPILQSLLASLFTFSMTALGASLIFFFKSINKQFLNFLLGISSGVMISASFWSLLLPSIEMANNTENTPLFSPMLGFLCGGLLIILSDIILSKILENNQSARQNILLFSAVTFHNIPEGIIIGVAFGTTGNQELSIISALILALGIGIQNFPEGACISIPLRQNGKSRMYSFLFGSLSAVVEIFGAIIGVLLALTINNALSFMLGMAAGAMISVVSSELIPQSFTENKVTSGIGFLLGFLIMMILDVTL